RSAAVPTPSGKRRTWRLVCRGRCRRRPAPGPGPLPTSVPASGPVLRDSRLQARDHEQRDEQRAEWYSQVEGRVGGRPAYAGVELSLVYVDGRAQRRIQVGEGGAQLARRGAQSE